MVYFVGFGIVLSLCFRRNPLNVVANMQLRASALVLIGLLLQFALAMYTRHTGSLLPWAFEASLALVLLAMALNYDKAGFRWMVAGCAMNLAALLANGGRMPVSTRALEIADLGHLADMSSSARHQPMTDGHAVWLGDWIPFLTPLGTNFVLSLGDVLIGIGIILYIFRYSLGRRDRA